MKNISYYSSKVTIKLLNKENKLFYRDVVPKFHFGEIYTFLKQFR